MNGLELGSKVLETVGSEVNRFIEGSGVVIFAVGTSVVVALVVLDVSCVVEGSEVGSTLDKGVDGAPVS